MAWADLAETSQSTTSTLTAGMQTYYDKTFLSQAVHNLHMMQFAQKRPLPEGEGKQIRFFRYNELSPVTTALTEGTNPAGTAIYDHYVTRTIEEWGAWAQNASLVSKTHIDRNLKGQSELFGSQAGRTIDLRIMKEVVTCGSHSLAANASAGACGAGMRLGQWGGAVDTGGTNLVNTIFAQTAVTAAGGFVFTHTDHWLIGGLLTFISGKNYGQSRYVYDNTATLYSVKVYPSFEYAPSDGDKFIYSHPGYIGSAIATAEALTPSDTLTHKVFALTREDLQVYSAPEYEGGYYVFLIGPTTNAGFMTDTAGGWMGLAQYRGQEMYRGEIGRYMGFRVVQTNQPFRCTLPTTATTGGPGATSATDFKTCGANYSPTGTGHYSLAFGREAFGVTKLPGNNTPKIIVKPFGSAGAADPLNMQSSIGWKMEFVPAALNACWCVSVVSGG
jgi:N4-gp56 family major capsid protein